MDAQMFLSCLLQVNVGQGLLCYPPLCADLLPMPSPIPIVIVDAIKNL